MDAQLTHGLLVAAFKAAIVIAIGHPRLRRWGAALFGAAILLGGAIPWLWPVDGR